MIKILSGKQYFTHLRGTVHILKYQTLRILKKFIYKKIIYEKLGPTYNKQNGLGRPKKWGELKSPRWCTVKKVPSPKLEGVITPLPLSLNLRGRGPYHFPTLFNI